MAGAHIVGSGFFVCTRINGSLSWQSCFYQEALFSSGPFDYLCMAHQIYTAPPGTGRDVRGKHLPQLLFEACERYENLHALNQPSGDGWKPFSLDDFRRHSEEFALGLGELGIKAGDKVALFAESDVYFCIADMGCLIAGVADVPIYLTHEDDQIRYVIDHSEARAFVVSTAKHLQEVRHILEECESIETVVVAQSAEDRRYDEIAGRIRVLSLNQLRDLGRQRLRRDAKAVDSLIEKLSPDDLATIIYTSGTTGRPKGVMLTHENISHNTLTAFSGLHEYRPGADGEKVISFLPLSHVFARTLHYGHMHFGASVYFTDPDDLSDAFLAVRPTIFATVPRVLEKVYGRILERITSMTGPKKALATWALDLAERFDLATPPTGLYKLQLALADRLVFKKWRAALGGRVKYVISGGAALSSRLTNLFAAAGVHVLQGYGLTETSPVITFNRPGRNRAGTVGEPIPGVEVMIADDGEILTRGPHIMKGYYKNDERTTETIDADGWLHTGDVGEMSEDGYLTITDRKKDLFKLSTGKYVMPQPLENRLTTHPLVEQAVVVGSGFKYCTALIFPDQEKVHAFARSRGLDAGEPIELLLEKAAVRERFKELVEEANHGMDRWSRIKRFRTVPAHLTPENGFLTPTMKVRRGRVQEEFSEQIESMYDEKAEADESIIVVERPEATNPA